MLRKCVLLLLFSFISMGVVTNLSSTTIIRADLPELVQDAESIALGTVTDKECSWIVGDGNHKLIYTTYALEVEELIKGYTTQNSITFKVVGGEVGDVSLKVPSAPHFEIGERVIVLLWPDGYERLSDVVGWSQGDFHVVDGIVVERNVPLDEFIAHLTNIIMMED